MSAVTASARPRPSPSRRRRPTPRCAPLRTLIFRSRAQLSLTPPLSRSQAARFWHGRVTTTGNESHKGAPPQGLLRNAAPLRTPSSSSLADSEYSSEGDDDEEEDDSAASEESGVFSLQQQDGDVPYQRRRRRSPTPL